jgi:hypothetical protein
MIKNLHLRQFNLMKKALGKAGLDILKEGNHIHLKPD